MTCAAGLLYFVFPVAPLTAQSVIWAFLYATAPFVVFMLLNFQLELPLAAMVALALYALVRTKALALRRWALALGLVLGLGMLTKPPFAAYLSARGALGAAWARPLRPAGAGGRLAARSVHPARRRRPLRRGTPAVAPGELDREKLRPDPAPAPAADAGVDGAPSHPAGAARGR